MALNSADIDSPDSSWAESTRIVRGRGVHAPSTTLENRPSRPGTSAAASPVRCQPATQSKTTLDTVVLLQTTMNTGGVSPRAAASDASHASKALT